ncbi:MAG: hypothetical protein K2X82_17560 [Gemmataceae bacterium]|nr:hypothetical protein [Gemmataceae bacterium]
MELPGNKLREFARFVREAADDPGAELAVRAVMGEVVASCPTRVLVQLAECVIQCRRTELRGEADRN